MTTPLGDDGKFILNDDHMLANANGDDLTQHQHDVFFEYANTLSERGDYETASALFSVLGEDLAALVAGTQASLPKED